MTTATGLLKPLPALPGPDETHRLIRARIADLPENQPKSGWQNQEHPRIPNTIPLTKTIQGNHGWTATLVGSRFERTGRINIPNHLLAEILKPLCDWWEEAARNAVMDCPAPENVRYPAVMKDGSSRMIHTVSETYDRWDILIFDDKDWGNLHLPTTLAFNGKANISDIIWPFAPPTLINPMAEAIRNALGTQIRTDYLQRQHAQAPWHASTVDGRRNWNTQRLYEDWSGTTPAERNVLTKQTKPLKPTGQWNRATAQTTGPICRGQPECQYSGNSGNSGNLEITKTRRKGYHSECDNRWHAYSLNLLKAFMGANPEVQFGPTTPECLRQLTPAGHRCTGTGPWECSPRALPLDHDQLCRFPDGERFIISQTYCNDELCPSCLDNIGEWQIQDPQIAWQTAGKSRSWYSPGRSNLLLIGHRPTIERLKLDYPLPDAQPPTGCIRWGEDDD